MFDNDLNINSLMFAMSAIILFIIINCITLGLVGLCGGKYYYSCFQNGNNNQKLSINRAASMDSVATTDTTMALEIEMAGNAKGSASRSANEDETIEICKCIPFCKQIRNEIKFGGILGYIGLFIGFLITTFIYYLLEKQFVNSNILSISFLIFTFIFFISIIISWIMFYYGYYLTISKRSKLYYLLNFNDKSKNNKDTNRIELEKARLRAISIKNNSSNNKEENIDTSNFNSKDIQDTEDTEDTEDIKNSRDDEKDNESNESGSDDENDDENDDELSKNIEFINKLSECISIESNPKKDKYVLMAINMHGLKKHNTKSYEIGDLAISSVEHIIKHKCSLSKKLYYFKWIGKGTNDLFFIIRLSKKHKATETVAQSLIDNIKHTVNNITISIGLSYIKLNKYETWKTCKLRSLNNLDIAQDSSYQWDPKLWDRDTYNKHIASIFDDDDENEDIIDNNNNININIDGRYWLLAMIDGDNIKNIKKNKGSNYVGNIMNNTAYNIAYFVQKVNIDLKNNNNVNNNIIFWMSIIVQVMNLQYYYIVYQK